MKEVGIVALNTFVIYIYLVVMTRLVGRRALAQLTPLDLMILILLGSSVETAMVHGSTLLRMGFVSASVLFASNAAIGWLMLRSRRFRHLVGAGPTLLIHNGKYVEEHLKRLGITHADLMEALRERECATVEEVRLAVMEPDGRINVILYEHGQPKGVGLPASLQGEAG